MFQIYNEAIYDLLETDENVGTHLSEFNSDGDPFTVPLSSLDMQSAHKTRIARKLMLNGGSLRLRMNKHDSFFVEDLSVFEVNSAEEAIHKYEQGVRNKIVSSHKLNHASSRSHIIFNFQVHRQTSSSEPALISRMMLVDLAGSERLSYL